MPKQYELVKKIEHIQDIVEKYRQILIDRENNLNLINKFSNFDYWYFLPGIDIFAPNLFLAYQEMATEPYPENYPKGYGMDGTRARKWLEKYFFVEVTDDDEKKKYEEKFKEFAEEHSFKIKERTKMKEKIHILKPKPEFVNSFIANENLIESPILKEFPKTPKANKIDKRNPVSSYEIAKEIREIILSINEICKLQKKNDIFDQATLFKLWGNIEKSCKSKNDFKGFAENLYKLIREATRYINPNKKNKNDPHYIYMIPDNFIKKNPTKHFWDIVNTLRHYFVHDEIGSIADVYKEFLGSSSGPESSKDYSKLQIEVLDLFKNSMNILLEMVKNDLNRSKNP